jgi:hypothetical protein
MDQPYTRRELEAGCDRFPNRGPVCEHCKQHVPQFADLTHAQHMHVLELIRNNHSSKAMAELSRATACDRRWSKIWVLHHGQPQPRFPGPPCPNCGAPLPSSNSQQCLSCSADWHGMMRPALEPTPPARGSLLWSGFAGTTVRYVVFDSLRIERVAPSDAPRSSWVLLLATAERWDGEVVWCPSRMAFETALPGWESEGVQALEMVLIRIAQ